MRCAVASRSQRLCAATRTLGSAALLIGLLVLNSMADARSAQSAQGGAIALAFDGSSQTLLRASADTLYRSGDGGRDWAPMKLPPAAQRGSIASVAVSAGGKGVIYVAGPGIGVLRSADGGGSWSARNDGLPGSTVVAFATHADQPDTVYAYVEGHGIFRSQDDGLHWKLMDAGPRGGIVRFVHSNMPGSMQTGWFFAASTQGVRRAMDCFCGWRDAGELGRAATAEGAPNWQQPNQQGEMPAPPHNQEGHTWKHADGMLYRIVRDGWRDPFNKTARLTMPAFGQTLSPGETQAVIGYLKTLWSPEQLRFQEAESRRAPFPSASR